jgi:hypothetical protein
VVEDVAFPLQREIRELRKEVEVVKWLAVAIFAVVAGEIIAGIVGKL